MYYDSQDRIMVSLTLMLVIATIVASIQTTLPATPYLKMIDIWLFVAMNMMVYLLVYHTFLEYITKKDDKKDIFFTKSRRNSNLEETTRCAFPSFLLLLCMYLVDNRPESNNVR